MYPTYAALLMTSMEFYPRSDLLARMASGNPVEPSARGNAEASSDRSFVMLVSDSAFGIQQREHFALKKRSE
jgi:hypothetical protein